MTLVDWLKKYDNQRSLMLVVFFILIAYPFIYPIGLPVVISKYTRMFYDEIENIPDGGIVVMDFCFDAGNWGELGAGSMVLLKHLGDKHIERDIKLIIYSSNAQGPFMLARSIDEIGGESELTFGKYGEDWANLGYMPVGIAGLAAMATEFNSIFKSDYEGTPVEELPLMRDMTDINDVDLIIVFQQGGLADSYRTQWAVPYNIVLLELVQGVHVASTTMFISSDQVNGMIASIRGAAEYELLTGYLGVAVISTDALSMGHLVVIIVIILGNITYFSYERVREKKTVEVT